MHQIKTIQDSYSRKTGMTSLLQIRLTNETKHNAIPKTLHTVNTRNFMIMFFAAQKNRIDLNNWAKL